MSNTSLATRLRELRRDWPLDRRGRPERRVKLEQNIYVRRGGKLEVGYRDADGTQRWRTVEGGITAARAARDAKRTKRNAGERETADPRMTFGQAADKWWEARAARLRDSTRDVYERHLRLHLRPVFGAKRLNRITPSDIAGYVVRKEAAGCAGWTIKGHLTVLSAVFTYAGDRLGFTGRSPVAALAKAERPSTDDASERRVYTREELDQMIAATVEPWRTLFRLADVIGGRESELLALWWEELDLNDVNAATIRFTHQVDRTGRRVPLKTEESKATLPLPRAAAAMMLEYRLRSTHTGRRSLVFATRTGKAISQRDVLRALYRAQERARTPQGLPTFPELFEHDENGHLKVDARGNYVRRNVKRRDLDLPHFHSMRHGAAMDCDDAEEARDLLRHKNSNVTRAIYRAHFDDRRREALRARMERRMASSGKAQDGTTPIPNREAR